MGRAPCCEKIGLKKGRWTAEEDEILSKYIQDNGEGSWRSLPKNAGLKRCGKSCRLRWINYLRGDLKRGNITTEEEEMIIKVHNTLGNRWSLIAGHLPGRTDNEIKNYWNSHLSRRIHTFRRPIGEVPPKIVMDFVKMSPAYKKKDRTSRAAMKRKNNNKITSSSKVLKKKPEEVKTTEGGFVPCVPLEEKILGDEERRSMNLGPHVCRENSGSDERLQEGTEVRILGPYEDLDTGLLFGEDIIDVPSEFFQLNEEQEHGVDSFGEGQMGLVDSSKGTPSEEGEGGGMSSNGENSEWYSSCSMTSCFQDDVWANWNWEEVGESSNTISGEGEELLSWLWESDNIEGGEQVVDCERQEALAAWLLS